MSGKALSGAVLLMLLFMGVLASVFAVAPFGALAASTPSSSSPTALAPELEWNRTYGGASRAYSVQQTSDGGYIAVGKTPIYDEVGSIRGYACWVVKTGRTGVMEWNRTINPDTAGIGYSIQQTRDGEYIIAGGFGRGSALAKIDQSGNIKWIQYYEPGTFITAGGFYSVQQTRDGGYIVAGSAILEMREPYADFWLVKTTADGTAQWNQTYGGAYYEWARSVQQTSDGGYIIAGYSDSTAARDNDFLLVKTGSGGGMEWSRTYGGAKNEYADSVKQTSDGGYIIAGYSESGIPPVSDMHVVKASSSGAMQWEQTYGGANSDYATDVLQESDGGYVVAGYTNSKGAGMADCELLKISSTGAVLWDQTYGTVISEVVDCLDKTSDGGYILAGTNGYYSGLMLLKLGYDADGDGIPNDWERNGIDYNGDSLIDLDLPALGADWQHKDIFVEVDYMTGHNFFEPGRTLVESAFANAPVDNPDGIPGITLHINVDESFPHSDFFRSSDYKENDFDIIKSSYFGTAEQRNGTNSRYVLEAKKLAYHYCLFVHKISDFNGTHWVPTNWAGEGEWPGNDFTVAMGGFPAFTGTAEDQAAAFMHELGHNLGLHHGGGDKINCKPNYLSIMNYAFAFGSLVPWRPLDYSRKALPTLYEGSLDEPYGVQGSGFWQYTVWNNSKPGHAFGLVSGPLDWNGNGNSSEWFVRANINNLPGYGFEPSDPDEALEGYDDWANVKLPFGDTEDFLDGVHIHMSGDEITSDIVEAMRQSRMAMHEVGVYNVSSPSAVWSPGNALSVSFALGNLGGSDENVNVTVYANNTAIAASSLTVKAGNLTTATLPYTGQALTPGTYTLKAVVDPVAQETYTADNTATGSAITVTQTIPEFPPALLLAALIILTLAFSLAFRRKAKP